MTSIRPFLVGDEEEIRIGLALGNRIALAVYAPPLCERVIPTPLPCSPCLRPKAVH